MAMKVKGLNDAHTYSRDMHTPVQWALTGLSDLSLLVLHFEHASGLASLLFGLPVHSDN